MKKRVVAFFLAAVSIAVTMSLSSCEIETKPMEIGRTILIYMAADNNLSSIAERNIESLKQGYVPDFFIEGSGDVLLVFVDKRYEAPKLLRISKDEFDVVHTEVVAEYEELDSASDSVMHGILSHAASLFPARENGLILWSHGTGWLPQGYYSNPYSVSSDGSSMPMALEADPYAHLVKSFGAENGNEIDIKSLAAALPIHYSFIIFDACLMGGVEVAYELKDHCDYLVASPAEILAEGFPYTEIMDPLFNTSVRGGLSIASEMFFEYYDSIREYHPDMGEGATIALHDMSAIQHLAEVCAGIFESGRDSMARADMSDLQGFFRSGRHWFYDMEDFLSRFATEDQMESYRDAMSQVVLYRAATEKYNLGGNTEFEINKYCGLSTYVPAFGSGVLDEYYKSLAWNQAVRMVE